MNFSNYFIYGEQEYFSINDNYPVEFLDDCFWLDTIP